MLHEEFITGSVEGRFTCPLKHIYSNGTMVDEHHMAQWVHSYMHAYIILYILLLFPLDK